MGNIHSNCGALQKLAWAMPSYCVQDYNITPKTIELVQTSWQYAQSGTTAPYVLAQKKEAGLTPLVFFYNQFYFLLFELVPDAKALFKRGMKTQGAMLANMIKVGYTNIWY